MDDGTCGYEREKICSGENLRRIRQEITLKHLRAKDIKQKDLRAKRKPQGCLCKPPQIQLKKGLEEDTGGEAAEGPA